MRQNAAVQGSPLARTTPADRSPPIRRQPSLRTAKLIVLGADSMPSSSNSDKPGTCGRCIQGTRCRPVRDAVEVTSTVCVCPPDIVGLVQRDATPLALQEPGAAQAGNSGTDDRDTHRNAPLCWHRPSNRCRLTRRLPRQRRPDNSYFSIRRTIADGFMFFGRDRVRPIDGSFKSSCATSRTGAGVRR